MRIAVIGGGPAGLYFAMLMKKRDPGLDITVFEQNPKGATYGWGVVFSDVALSFLKDADPDFFADFTRGHERCDYMEIVHKGEHVRMANNHFSRVSRIELLRVLQDHCARVGVDVRYGQRIEDLQAFDGYDLIVGADGVNSRIRTLLAAEFEPQFEARRNLFAWYGTKHLFHPVSLIFRENADGVFISHCYQYSQDASTFLVEVDPETFAKAGLDRMGEADSLAYCGRVFADDLGGEPLLSNRSVWFKAQVVKNKRWHVGNVVLLGDALRTIHFSLGSGTRMAMQDAIALYEALGETAEVGSALNSFEAKRRESSGDFSEAARRSLDWYETVKERMDLDPVSFAYSYMTRTGRVTHDKLKERDPELVAAYERKKQSASRTG